MYVKKLHWKNSISFIFIVVLTDDGEWGVVQQGLNNQNGFARRYHWHSPEITSFVDKPHSFIFGENQGLILNLTDHGAGNTRNGIVEVTHEHPDKLLADIEKLSMPRHHHVAAHNVNLKRLGSVLAVAYEQQFRDFESLLLLQGVGPRTIQSLTLVSEIIYGTPSRFKDPARFSFAHGGKDGHPAPVPLQICDESIDILRTSLNRAKVGMCDKQKAIKKISEIARVVEQNNDPMAHFNKVIAKERCEARQYGGRTVFDKPGKRATTLNKQKDAQLTLFN